MNDFNDNDDGQDEELARQRRAQIEAYVYSFFLSFSVSDLLMCANRDEEFARQIQAAMSPVQQQSPVSHHQNFTQMDEDEQQDNSFNASISPTINPMATFQHNDTYFPQERQIESSLRKCSRFFKTILSEMWSRTGWRCYCLLEMR